MPVKKVSKVSAASSSIETIIPAVVQVVALKKAMWGNVAPAWTGSGTIVHPKGIILTNCHVANPRAMGMPSPPADQLAIAITGRSDEPPALTYIAEIVAQEPQLDLAVLKIVGALNKGADRNLNLPYIPLGDSDDLQLGDELDIFGFPGIGGETMTFTHGSVSGFTSEKTVRDRRAWIKTDATIAGGNSGGTAVNKFGQLVGIPTQAAAGAGITPVDARPVVDTNRDGRVDQRDTPMTIGGFINGLRPVNLAKPLLEKIGMDTRTSAPKGFRKGSVGGKKGTIKKISGKSGGSKSATKSASAPAPAAAPSIEPQKSSRRPGSMPSLRGGTKGTSGSRSTIKREPVFSQLTFATRVTRDGRPINPSNQLPSGGKRFFASFNFENMRKGTPWSQVWAINGEKVLDQAGKWEDGGSGLKTIAFGGNNTLPDGEYHLILTVRNQIVAEGKVYKGRKNEDRDTEVSGVIGDERTGRGIPGVQVLALKPGVSVRQFMQRQDQSMIYTAAQTDRGGRFTFPQQLPKGNAYSLIVIAKGYQDMAIEGALRIGQMAPEKADLNPLMMRRG